MVTLLSTMTISFVAADPEDLESTVTGTILGLPMVSQIDQNVQLSSATSRGLFKKYIGPSNGRNYSFQVWIDGETDVEDVVGEIEEWESVVGCTGTVTYVFGSFTPSALANMTLTSVIRDEIHPTNAFLTLNFTR